MITLDDLVQNYLVECGENLEVVEKNLLALELGGTEVDEELARRAIQAMHAMKAGAGLFDFAEVGELAHQTEHALALIRWRRIAPNPDRISVLLSAVDKLRELIGQPCASGRSGIAEILAQLAAMCPAGRGAVAPRGGRDRLRALLVEDETTSRFLLETFLSRYGVCDTAGNGMEAVERFRAAREQGQKYDLICMDIMMPEMDGAEAVRHLRAMEAADDILPTNGVRIIMTTAVDDLRQVAQCFRDLCDAYLVKPIDLAKLLKYMKSYRLVE